MNTLFKNRFGKYASSWHHRCPMRSGRFPFFLLVLVTFCVPYSTCNAQPSGASNAVAWPIPHTTVPFRISDEGVKLPDIQWGLDLAWISESNLRRGVQFAGQDLIDIVRLSFQTTNSVESGQLSRSQINTLNRH